ncbi:MAG: FecR domain-containing protein, partial [Candidatus Omnitrophota bacterium]
MRKGYSGIIRTLFICAVAVSAFLLFSAQAAESIDACKIVHVKGEPKMMKAGSSDWNVCKYGMTIGNGDRVKTVKDEAVEISFSDKRDNVIKVEGDSDVYVAKSDSPYSINLVNGSIMTLLNNLPKDSKFEVRTPAGLSGARGTGWRSATDG